LQILLDIFAQADIICSNGTPTDFGKGYRYDSQSIGPSPATYRSTLRCIWTQIQPVPFAPHVGMQGSRKRIRRCAPIIRWRLCRMVVDQKSGYERVPASDGGPLVSRFRRQPQSISRCIDGANCRDARPASTCSSTCSSTTTTTTSTSTSTASQAQWADCVQQGASHDQ
jgi:hypothetical protein